LFVLLLLVDFVYHHCSYFCSFANSNQEYYALHDENHWYLTATIALIFD